MKPVDDDRNHGIARDTIAVHAGRMSREHFGVVNTPVYRASTILFDNFAALDAADAPFIYGRLGTPSSKSLEDAITALEGAARTVLCPSGLNAIATAILSVCSAGDHLLVTDSCYVPTRSLCDKTLRRMGIETSYYDPVIGGGIAKAGPALFQPLRAELGRQITRWSRARIQIAQAALGDDSVLFGALKLANEL